MKFFWHYVKSAMVPFLYLIFMAFIAMGIVMINDNLLYLKIILSVLNISFYAYIVAMVFYKDGETALKTRLANDLERIQIVKTGEDRPLKLIEEYKPWKGFITGLFACIPCVILLIVHTILIFGVSMEITGAGAITGFLYMMFFSLSRLVLSAGAPSPYLYYVCLICLVVIPLCTGIPYMLGARKIEKQQEKIKARQREIYGDEN